MSAPAAEGARPPPLLAVRRGAAEAPRSTRAGGDPSS